MMNARQTLLMERGGLGPLGINARLLFFSNWIILPFDVIPEQRKANPMRIHYLVWAAA